MATKLKRTTRKSTKQTAPAQPTDEERKRATDAEMTKRIDTVVGLLVSGARRSEILEYSGVQWHLERSQTDEYIAAATALIKLEAAKTREDSFAEHIAFRRKLRKMAESSADWRVALASAQDEAKLLDLYPAEKRKLEGTITTVSITSDEMAIAAAEAKTWETEVFPPDAEDKSKPAGSVGNKDAP